MKRYFNLFLSLIFTAASAFALPRYALLTGMKCASCHVNPTGGELRTTYGMKGYTVDAIPVHGSESDTALMFNPKIANGITLGGDFRTQFLYDGASQSTSFQAMTASFYAAVDLTKQVTFYFKDDIENPVSNPSTGQYGGPEAYGIVHVSNDVYVKPGMFLPDYGWRVDDHTQYTRGGDLGFLPGVGFNDGLIFLPSYKDIGVEAGWMPGNFMITASLLNGTGNISPIWFDKEKAYTGKVQYSGSMDSFHYILGASGYGYSSYHMFGPMAGFGVGDLTMFGELDWTNGRLSPVALTNNILTGVKAMAAFGEADYAIVQGVNAVGRYEVFDPRLGYADDPNAFPGPNGTLNKVQRVTAGLEIFPHPCIEVRPQWRFNMETPTAGNDVGLIQVHYWF